MAAHCRHTAGSSHRLREVGSSNLRKCAQRTLPSIVADEACTSRESSRLAPASGVLSSRTITALRISSSSPRSGSPSTRKAFVSISVAAVSQHPMIRFPREPLILRVQGLLDPRKLDSIAISAGLRGTGKNSATSASAASTLRLRSDMPAEARLAEAAASSVRLKSSTCFHPANPVTSGT